MKKAIEKVKNLPNKPATNPWEQLGQYISDRAVEENLLPALGLYGTPRLKPYSPKNENTGASVRNKDFRGRMHGGILYKPNEEIPVYYNPSFVNPDNKEQAYDIVRHELIHQSDYQKGFNPQGRKNVQHFLDTPELKTADQTYEAQPEEYIHALNLKRFNDMLEKDRLANPWEAAKKRGIQAELPTEKKGAK